MKRVKIIEVPEYVPIMKKGGMLKNSPTPLDSEFYSKLQEIANKLGVHYDDLLAIMTMESGLNSSSANNSKANNIGLIQLSEKNAISLGITPKKLKELKPSEQLDYVYKFYKQAGVKPGDSLDDIYIKTFLPAAANESDNMELGNKNSNDKIWGLSKKDIYNENVVFDINKTNSFTKGDVKNFINSRRDSLLSQGYATLNKDLGLNLQYSKNNNPPIKKPEEKFNMNFESPGNTSLNERDWYGRDVVRPNKLPIKKAEIPSTLLNRYTRNPEYKGFDANLPISTNNVLETNLSSIDTNLIPLGTGPENDRGNLDILPNKKNITKTNKSLYRLKPYYGKDSPSSYTEEQWNQLANQLGFDPNDPTLKGTTNEAKFEEFLYKNPDLKPLLDETHKVQPIGGRVDAKIGKRYDIVFQAAQKFTSPDNGKFSPVPLEVKSDSLGVQTRPETDKSYEQINKKPIVKPTYKGSPFDYTQVIPEGLALINEPGINTFARKSYVNEYKPSTLNIQSELNDNTSDMYYAIKNLGKSATSKGIVSQLTANKYAANNKIYGNKYNFDSQSLNQTNNLNQGELTRIDQENYNRAKNQFDERDIAKERLYARKNEIFNSLSNKLASYKKDENTKKLWFDLLSKNYNFKNNSFEYDPETYEPIGLVPNTKSNNSKNKKDE